MVTNGHRAKANRIYEGFLCSKFEVDKDIHPDPSDDNPDLRQRTYCSACHKTLEPMATFFKRWPTAGNVNYIFNTSEELDDVGSIFGQQGNGMQDLGKFVSQNDKFSSCMIKRSFEMIYGRTMTQSEGEAYLARYLEVLKDSGMELKPVMKMMLLEQEFADNREAL